MSDYLVESAALDAVLSVPAEGDGVAGPVRCPNCETDRVGAFCHGCGQRDLGERLTLRRLWGEFASRVFNLDRGLLHTVVAALRQPGAVAADYVAGRRRTYTNPLSFFLLVATVSLLTMQLFEDQMIATGSPGFYREAEREEAAAAAPAPDHEASPTENAMAAAADRLNGDDGTGLMRVYMEGMTRYNTPLSLLLALYLVPPFRLLFGNDRNVAELSVFALYAVGAMTLIATLMLPLMFIGDGPTGALVMTGVMFLMYLGYGAWGAVGFYRERSASVAFRGAVGMSVAYVGYYVTIVLFAGLYVLAAVLHEAEMTWGGLLAKVAARLFG